MSSFSKIRIAAIAVCLFFNVVSINAFSQTISSFENLVLPPDSFNNGSNLSGGFTSGAVFFQNNFADWGGGFTSWDGYAYSNMNDTVTAGFMNQYSSFAGNGVNSSEKFAVGYCYPVTRLILLNPQQPKIVKGFYVTNNTYAAISMRDGDAYSKKFGGVSGNDPDWFKLSIWGYRSGTKTDTIDFYLADYRFENNNFDYIVKDWQWVNLESLGIVDSLEMQLTSTDNGQYGMNTPGYYCMDDFITDCIPEVENYLGSAYMDCSENIQLEFNLDTIFNDNDTPDSLMNYSIVYHSAGNVIIHAFADIIDNILFVNNPCMTKDNYFYFDTIVVQANSAGLFVTDTLFISGESSSGVAQIKRNSFSVFPNPVENDLFILNTEENNSIYEITDLSGRKILQSFMQDAYTTKLDVHSLNSGIYLLKKTNSLGVKTIKFIKS